MPRRITENILTFISLIYLPWWITVLVVAIVLWRENVGYEFVIPFFIADLIYAPAIEILGGFAFPGTVIIVLLLIGRRMISRRLTL